MPDYTPMPKVSRLEVITNAARRRRTDEQKRRIVAESFSGSRRDSATARRYWLRAAIVHAAPANWVCFADVRRHSGAFIASAQVEALSGSPAESMPA